MSNLNKHMNTQGKIHAENAKNPRPIQAQTTPRSACLAHYQRQTASVLEKGYCTEHLAT